MINKQDKNIFTRDFCDISLFLSLLLYITQIIDINKNICIITFQENSELVRLECNDIYIILKKRSQKFSCIFELNFTTQLRVEEYL